MSKFIEIYSCACCPYFISAEMKCDETQNEIANDGDIDIGCPLDDVKDGITLLFQSRRLVANEQEALSE